MTVTVTTQYIDLSESPFMCGIRYYLLSQCNKCLHACL